MTGSVTPPQWLTVPLENVTLRIVGGGTPSKSKPEYYQGEIPWMSVKDMNKHVLQDTADHISQAAVDNSSTNVIPAGTPIVATRMSLGKIVVANFDSAINQDLKALFLPAEFHRDYLVYWYRSVARKIEQMGTGTTVKGIRLEGLKGLDFALPPLAEQKVIADKLDTLLAQVETTKARLERIPQILKRFRQSVLAAAVSGRLTEEWRQRNPNSTTETLLEGHSPLPKPARWKSRSDGFIQGNYATAVGKPKSSPVPEWKWISLVEVARMESGHTPSRNKPEYWNGNVCWIGIRDANKNHGKTIQDTEQKTNELGLANSASRLLPAGTVCISRTASVGYVVKMGKDMATSQDFVNWVPSPVIDPDWLKWLFVAERDSLLKFGKGSTHTTVYFPEWLSMHVLLPHIDEQLEIVRQVDQLFAHADRIEQQVNNALTRVNNITQSILAKAFRGELTEQWRKDNPALISGDNSAEALLDRIKAERAAQQPKKKTRNKKPKSGNQTIKD